MEYLNENNNLFIEDCCYDKQDLLNIYRLQKQLLIEEDIIASLEECINIWQNHSWDFNASWLFFPDKDEDILSNIKSMRQFTSFEEYSK